MGAPVKALGALSLSDVPFFLMATDQHDPLIADAGQAGPHGPIVADGAVAVQFGEFRKI